jgi:hypothetical protein
LRTEFRGGYLDKRRMKWREGGEGCISFMICMYAMYVARMVEKETCVGGKARRKEPLGRPDVDGWIILGWVLER